MVEVAVSLAGNE